MSVNAGFGLLMLSNTLQELDRATNTCSVPCVVERPSILSLCVACDGERGQQHLDFPLLSSDYRFLDSSGECAGEEETKKNSTLSFKNPLKNRGGPVYFLFVGFLLIYCLRIFDGSPSIQRWFT